MQEGLIIKLDSSGNVKFAKSIGSTSTDEFHSVIATSDGGFIIGGISYHEINIREGDIVYSERGRQGGIIVKYDNLDRIEWVKNLKGGSNEITSVIEMNNVFLIHVIPQRNLKNVPPLLIVTAKTMQAFTTIAIAVAAKRQIQVVSVQMEMDINV